MVDNQGGGITGFLKMGFLIRTGFLAEVVLGLGEGWSKITDELSES